MKKDKNVSDFYITVKDCNLHYPKIIMPKINFFFSYWADYKTAIQEILKYLQFFFTQYQKNP